MRKDVLKCEISAAPLTDHYIISLSLQISQQTRLSENIWKFNNNLLLDNSFFKQVKILYQSVNELDMSSMYKWEWFKNEIKQLAIEKGKEIAVIRKCKQKN